MRVAAWDVQVGHPLLVSAKVAGSYGGVMTTITAMSPARVFRLTMPVPWGPGRAHQYLVQTRLESADGGSGSGFSWTVDAGAQAVAAMLAADCRPVVLGGPASPELAWERMRWHFRETGTGITTLAMAAVDIALWDLAARSAGIGLAEWIGPRRDVVPVYASGVNRHLQLDELTEQVRRWVAAGHSRVKIKVGLPDLDADLQRVAAVRQVIGPDRLLMVDANQLWDLPAARRAAKKLAAYDIFWLEEPLPADDTRGYAQLRASIDIPVAAGENLYSLAQFRDLILAGGCDFVQPNLCRVGGITPFLRIAEFARAFSIPVMPHLLPDISGQVARCLPLSPMVEDIDTGSFEVLGALAEPSGVAVHGDAMQARPALGHGLVFGHQAAEEIG
jgi:L-alanine-DL-glutamate epimerase-like enolase superfamily enzyme